MKNRFRWSPTTPSGIVASHAEGKDKKQIFTELKETLNKVGIQPHDESIRKLARQIWRDLNLDQTAV